jgi:hypothetical protein
LDRFAQAIVALCSLKSSGSAGLENLRIHALTRGAFSESDAGT